MAALHQTRLVAASEQPECGGSMRPESSEADVVVVGLGYVGLTVALILAESGSRVVGVERDPGRLEMLCSQRYADGDAMVAELMATHFGRGLTVSSELPIGAPVYVIAVSTPVSEEGRPDLDVLRMACEQVGRALHIGGLVILRCTVPPGTTREVVAPLIAAASGELRPGVDFHLVFAPERAVEGGAIQELSRLPQLIGGLSEACVAAAREVFRFVPLVVTAPNLESAETAKLLNNAFRDVSFAFANFATQLASRFGLDGAGIIALANLGYPRNPIALPSPGVGGPCLKKDSIMLGAFADQVQVDASLLLAARRINDSMPELVVEQVCFEAMASGLVPTGVRVLVCGMAFKGRPATADVRESPGVRIARLLAERGMLVHVHDPVVPAATLASLGFQLTALEQGLAWADVVVLATNHPAYASLGWSEVTRLTRPGVAWLDLWSMHRGSPLTADPSVRYRTLGTMTRAPVPSI